MTDKFDAERRAHFKDIVREVLLERENWLTMNEHIFGKPTFIDSAALYGSGVTESIARSLGAVEQEADLSGGATHSRFPPDAGSRTQQAETPPRFSNEAIDRFVASTADGLRGSGAFPNQAGPNADALDFIGVSYLVGGTNARLNHCEELAFAIANKIGVCVPPAAGRPEKDGPNTILDALDIGDRLAGTLARVLEAIDGAL